MNTLAMTTVGGVADPAGTASATPSTIALPAPRVPISVREGTMADYAFIDHLQSVHNKQIGFLKKAALEGKINAGQVIVAVAATPASPVAAEGGDAGVAATEERVGYCIGTDRYFKRDDVGIIYHLNVVPEKHRSLVGAQLVQAMFDKAHVSCRLFCLWCAQDIQANYFWESLGFSPIAFRAGSRLKDRVHIFWEKRIRASDTTTNWWYPTQTSGGSIREDRLVFPIPPGVKWSDPMPRVLPDCGVGILPAQIEDKKKPRGRDAHATNIKPLPPTTRRVELGRPGAYPVPELVAKKIKPKKAKLKHDPALVAKARELNGRWLELINNDPSALPAPGGKYQISKQIEHALTPALSQRERGKVRASPSPALLEAA